jgi:peptidyl-prolyl cis-trans isomerase SurA
VRTIAFKSATLATLIVAAISTGLAQVASHAPVVVQPSASSDVSVITPPVGRPVARVNGVVLTDRDLLREMLNIFPYARVHNGFPKAMEGDIRSGALKMIIFEELVYQEAKHRNMTVQRSELASAEASFRRQFGSPQEYQRFLMAEFQGSESQLRSKIARSLLIDRLLKLEVTDKAAVTTVDAKAFFDQHPEKFHVPDSYSFQSISIVPPDNATPAQIEEARKRAQDALRQAQATKSYEEFGVLAEKISDDDFRVMMGDHKTAERAKLPPSVAKALDAMQPGQVSNLIPFDVNDYTILRLNRHIPAGIENFDSIKDVLRSQLEKEKNEQLRSALALRLRKNAKIETV